MQHLGVLWESIRSSHEGTSVRFVALTEDLGSEAADRLASFARDSALSFELRAIDSELFDSMPVWGHVSRATYGRMALANLLREDRVIYLDADTLVVDSLEALWNQELGGAWVAAARQPRPPENWAGLGLARPEDYFNAGVMVIDLEAWRRGRVWERSVDYVQHQRDRLRFWDQCVLNAVLAGKVRYLDSKWNWMGEDATGRSIGEAAIVHFAGTLKPWHYQLEHPMKELYWRHLAKTPWAGYREPDRTLKRVLVKLLFPRRMRNTLRPLVQRVRRSLKGRDE